MVECPGNGTGVHVDSGMITDGEQTITVMRPRKPSLAGIDPYHPLDWEERDDNNIDVDLEQ